MVGARLRIDEVVTVNVVKNFVEGNRGRERPKKKYVEVLERHMKTTEM